MEKTKTKVSKVLNGLAKRMINADAREWPPECMVFMYQPVRPQRKSEAQSDIQIKNK